VIGHSHGEVGRAPWSDPVCHGWDQLWLSSDRM